MEEGGTNKKLKFRGRRKDNNKWIYGSVFVGKFRSFIQSDFMLPVSSEDNGGWIEIIPETLGQYIGVTDRDKKEVYKGDIVQHESGCIGVVIENKRDATMIGFAIIDIENDLPLPIFENELTVIGNIFENKELIEPFSYKFKDIVQ